MQRLPQLRGIRAFVAAAKYLSFKRAADELNVTPTAVSHNIKALEDELGVKLFNRLTRSLTLTNEGKIFAPLASEGFQKLHEAVDALSDSGNNGPLAISTTQSFASNWLSMRAHRFREKHPEYNLRIDASDSVKDIPSNNLDIAIRHGNGPYTGSHFVWVLNNYVVPVCSPKLIANTEKRKLEPSEILEFPLIVYEWSEFSAAVDPYWDAWFALSSTPTDKANHVETYSDEHICIQAALDCRGIALCSTLAISSYIESGELVIPTSSEFYLKDKSYYLVCEKNQASQRKILTFQDWLLDEADQYRETKMGMLIDDSHAQSR